MKNIKLFLILSLLALFTGCDEDQVIFDNQNGFAQSAFGEVGQNYGVFDDGSRVAKVRVDVTTISNVDRTIAISVNAAKTTATPAMYTIASNSLFVPAGANNGYILVTGHYDAIPAAQKFRLVLDLSDVTGTRVDPALAEHTLILQQACIKGTAGIYNVAVSVDGDAILSHQVTLVPTSADNTFSITSSWGPAFVATLTGNNAYLNKYLYPGTIKINCDDTIIFTGTDPANYDTGGAGTFDETTGKITISLSQALFNDSFTTICVFTPVP